jgi:hypothetical protein
VAQGGAGAEVIETFDRRMESRKIRKEDGGKEYGLIFLSNIFLSSIFLSFILLGSLRVVSRLE